MKTYAVLTGDIVGSTQLASDKFEAAGELLHRLAREFEEIHPGSLVGQPDIFRGDSWQICLQRPALAVTAAVFVRSGFKADNFETRIGIGWGAVDRLHTDRITESNGPAFARSGRALDGLDKTRRLGVVGSDTASAASPIGLLDAAVGLLDALINEWTQREAVAVYGTLRRLSQEAIADLPQSITKEGKVPTRQAIQDSLRRISWSGHIEPFLALTEQWIEQEAKR
jgi:hypothetical protein